MPERLAESTDTTAHYCSEASVQVQLGCYAPQVSAVCQAGFSKCFQSFLDVAVLHICQQGFAKVLLVPVLTEAACQPQICLYE